MECYGHSPSSDRQPKRCRRRTNPLASRSIRCGRYLSRTAMKMRERLFGGWRLLSWRWCDEAGEVDSPLGDDPVGQLMYDSSGTVSAQLARRNQLRFEDDDWRRATADEKKAAWSGYFAYF